VSRANAGIAFFDDITVAEYDDKGAFMRDLMTINLDSLAEWFLWTPAGQRGSIARTTDGHGDGASMTLSGITDIATAASQTHRFLADARVLVPDQRMDEGPGRDRLKRLQA